MHLRLNPQRLRAWLLDQSALVVDRYQLLPSRLRHLDDLGLLKVVHVDKGILGGPIKRYLLRLAKQISLADVHLWLLNLRCLDDLLALLLFLARL